MKTSKSVLGQQVANVETLNNTEDRKCMLMSSISDGACFLNLYSAYFVSSAKSALYALFSFQPHSAIENVKKHSLCFTLLFFWSLHFRSPSCQSFGGSSACLGGQPCEIPLLCKSQPSCHTLQVGS